MQFEGFSSPSMKDSQVSKQASTGPRDVEPLVSQGVSLREETFIADFTAALAKMFPKGNEGQKVGSSMKPVPAKHQAKSRQRPRGGAVAQPSPAKENQNWRSGSDDPQSKNHRLADPQTTGGHHAPQGEPASNNLRGRSRGNSVSHGRGADGGGKNRKKRGRSVTRVAPAKNI